MSRGAYKPARDRLPGRRYCETSPFEHAGADFTMSIGRYPDGRIDDCASMSLFAIEAMEKADDGKNPQLAFAVYHLVEMVGNLKRHYHAAYKGEI